MPELWIPYGGVETLVTVQAENVGAVVQPEAEKAAPDVENLSRTVRRAKTMFVCDSRPTTSELLRELSPTILASEGLKLVAAAPKKIELSVPELKGKVVTLAPPLPADSGAVFAEELQVQGAKLFVGTALPDPLYGILDSRVQACQNWASGVHMKAAESRKEMEPTPFEKTEAYKVVHDHASKIGDAEFLNIVPRGGRIRSVLEEAPFSEIRKGFLGVSMPTSRAMIIGTGGKGYDDTLSGVIRSAWCALPGVRRSGQVLLIAECSEGLGSTALEMMATGRIKGEARRKGENVDGLEEVFYLSKLKEEYDVLLLSGLPDTYAKSNLGLTTARGSGEAVGRMLNKIGRSTKVNIVSRANECRVESA